MRYYLRFLWSDPGLFFKGLRMNVCLEGESIIRDLYRMKLIPKTVGWYLRDALHLCLGLKHLRKY